MLRLKILRRRLEAFGTSNKNQRKTWGSVLPGQMMRSAIAAIHSFQKWWSTCISRGWPLPSISWSSSSFTLMNGACTWAGTRSKVRRARLQGTSGTFIQRNDIRDYTHKGDPSFGLDPVLHWFTLWRASYWIWRLWGSYGRWLLRHNLSAFFVHTFRDPVQRVRARRAERPIRAYTNWMDRCRATHSRPSKKPTAQTDRSERQLLPPMKKKVSLIGHYMKKIQALSARSATSVVIKLQNLFCQPNIREESSRTLSR